MSHFISICFICLKNTNNLTNINYQDVNIISFEDKLKYFVPGLELNSSIPKYICARCGRNLSRINEFKQKCLQNITAYEKFAQQITTIDSSFKHLSVVLNPDFLCESEIKVEDSKDFIIEQEFNDELIKNVGIGSLLQEIKQEYVEPNEDIKENIQIVPTLKNENISEQSADCQSCDENYEDQEKKLYECKKRVHKNDKQYTCEMCNKSFRLLDVLKQHKLIHTRKTFTCDVCNDSFSRLCNLKQHKLRHTIKKLFICEVCNKSFTQLDILTKHRSAHRVKKYICEVCNRPLKDLKRLKKHKLVHTADKPFTCKICNKSFRIFDHLKQHKLIHTNEKPFMCEVCNKSFKYLQNFRVHKFVHTDEKPFSCQVCNKSFKRKTYLKSHERIHNRDVGKKLFKKKYTSKTQKKSLICEVCNKSFKKKAYLKEHKRLHIARPFTCDVCYKSFILKQNLLYHLKAHSRRNDK